VGLDVSATKVVTLTDAHERGLITDTARGAYDFPIGNGVVVTGLFRRHETKDMAQDGMPLMYALKGTQGHSIGRRDLGELAGRGRRLFAAKFPMGSFELIVPVPSSSGVPLYLAHMVARQLGAPAVVCDVLRKRTVRAVLQSAPNLQMVHARDLRDYKQVLNLLSKSDPNSVFAVKRVNRSVRKYFRTVDIDRNARLPHEKRILIVDDSAQTGSSISDAAALLQQYFRPALVHGLVIVGK
jgi:adenine/guanine phosphoribosyltransferase-like PRPP-binding protein